MNTGIKEFNAGKIKYIIYSSSDASSKVITRRVINDLLGAIGDLPCKIVWISRMIPGKDHTSDELLKEFVENYAKKLKCLVMCEAGTMGAHTEDMGNIVKEVYEEDRKRLIENGFINIIWNSKMKKSTTNPYTMVYDNEAAESFISKYTGIVINRVSKSGDKGTSTNA